MKTTTLAVALAIAAIPAAAQDKPEGYTCCNLHHDTKDWISDANWLHAPMIPAGSPIKVLSYDSAKQATAEVAGKTMRIGLDYGNKAMSIQEFVSKLVVKSNPKSKIDRYPEATRTAIHSGKVIAGMTREQAIIAVGYPPAHKTPTVDEPVWQLWQSRAGRFEVRWNEKGTVQDVVGQK